MSIFLKFHVRAQRRHLKENAKDFFGVTCGANHLKMSRFWFDYFERAIVLNA